MGDNLTLMVSFSSIEDRNQFFVSLKDNSSALLDGHAPSLDKLDVLGGRTSRFVCRIALPITLGVASNLATDALKVTATEIMQKIQSLGIMTPGKNVSVEVVEPAQVPPFDFPL